MKVFWRTFVYNAAVDNDRLKRAYLEFGPIDDEQPAAPGPRRQRVPADQERPAGLPGARAVHPMFGRMENTNQAIELQITQEYTGQSKMLTYLGPMWEEVLKTDTGATKRRPQALVGNIVDGSAQGHADTAIVGVANLGNADNLTGHHFAQANLYAFGRLAWDWTLGSEDIARDWTRMTWSNDPPVVDTIVQMMMGSREALVSYQTPLGIGAPVPLERPLRADAERVVPARRLEPGLLQQGRQRGPRLQPLADRLQLRRAVLPAARSSATGTSRPRRRTCSRGFTTCRGTTG